MVRVELGSTDASNVVPAELKADIVTVIYDKATSEALLLVVIEPQGREDSAKKFSWPAYLANLRQAHRCESAVLIVVCWDAAEADKCRKAIPMGHPGYTLVPVVLGPRNGPDLDGAGPWITILAGAIGALDLETDSGRRTILDAITATGSSTPDIRTLTAIILAIASTDARGELEALMATKEYRSDFLDRIEAEGVAKGEARGLTLGEARGEAKALLKILSARGITLTSAQHDKVISCPDPGQLDVWLDRALVATSASDLFRD
jgi:hypothetical protein